MDKKMTDKELLEHIHKIRHLLETCQKQLEKGNQSIEIKDMKEEMSRLNHLKLEARKRGLSTD